MWKRDYAGRYRNSKTGWVVERMLNYAGHWRIVNPATQMTFDTADTKRSACERADIYAASNE